MSRLSRDKKRDQNRAPKGDRQRPERHGGAPTALMAALIEVRVPATGTEGTQARGASVGGVPVVAASGEEIQHAVLNHLQRIARATGQAVRATVHDERIGYVVHLRVETDGSSDLAGQPVRMGASGSGSASGSGAAGQRTTPAGAAAATLLSAPTAHTAPPARADLSTPPTPPALPARSALPASVAPVTPAEAPLPADLPPRTDLPAPADPAAPAVPSASAAPVAPATPADRTDLTAPAAPPVAASPADALPVTAPSADVPPVIAPPPGIPPVPAAPTSPVTAPSADVPPVTASPTDAPPVTTPPPGVPPVPAAPTDASPVPAPGIAADPPPVTAPPVADPVAPSSAPESSGASAASGASFDKPTHALRAVRETAPTFPLRAVREPVPLGENVPTFPLRAVPEEAAETAPTFSLRAVPESAEPDGTAEAAGERPPGTAAAPLGEFGPPPVMDAAPASDRPAASPFSPPVPLPLPAPEPDRPVPGPAGAYGFPPAPAPDPVAPQSADTLTSASQDPAPTASYPRSLTSSPLIQLPVTAPDSDARPTPARGFDAVAEAVLGDGAIEETPSVLAEPMERINEAVKEGRIETAAELAERTVEESSGVLGPEHPEVLRLRELSAYIAYLAGDPVRSLTLSLDVARIRRRAGDAEAAYGNVQSAASAWRAVRDPERGLELGGELIGLWAELADEDGPAAEDVEQLDSARARMRRLTERARRTD